MNTIFSCYNKGTAHTFGEEHPADCENMILPCRFEIFEKASESGFNRIGCVQGMLILGQEIERRKAYESVDSERLLNLICDDMSADLGFIVSALIKDSGPLSAENSPFGCDHFYIDEIEAARPELLPQILKELPEMVFTHLHVHPDMLSYYPMPLPHESRQPEGEEIPLAELLNSTTVLLAVYDEDEEQSYLLTGEQLEKLREMHENATSYPAQFIDTALWKPYLDAQFTEYLNTRVLYKYV